MPLKVIGAGLGRTGTVSLKLALEQLGVGRCYHMTELLAHPEHLPQWQRAIDGQPDWSALFAGYGATVDYPACIYWRELADLYPQAKVILTERDPDEWFASTQATIFSAVLRERGAGSPIAFVLKKLDALHGNLDDRAAMVDSFRRHSRAVIDGIARQRLLVYQVEQGWEPLCEFLGVPVPDTPFPRANTRAEFQATQIESRR
jgi:hypothetical protein